MLQIFAYRCTDLVIHNLKMININEGAAWCTDCQATSGHLRNLLCVLYGEAFTPWWTNDQVCLCKIRPCIYTSVFLTLWECFIDDSLLAVQQWEVSLIHPEDAKCNNNNACLIINIQNLIHLCREYVHILVSHLNFCNKHTLKPLDGRGNDSFKWAVF